MRSIAKSKDLRTYFTLKVYEMRRSFDSLALAQDDILNLMTLGHPLSRERDDH